jgi:ethanolamine transporter EutH
MSCLAFCNYENLVFFFLFFAVIIVVVLNVVSDVIIDANDVLPSLTDSIAVIELAAQSIGQRLGHFVVNGFDDLQKNQQN